MLTACDQRQHFSVDSVVHVENAEQCEGHTAEQHMCTPQMETCVQKMHKMTRAQVAEISLNRK